MKHICFDWAIKKILRDKVNFVILEGFLTELIGDAIKIESILESESNKVLEESKFNRVDILARSSDGKLILIEVQNSTEQDYFHRMLYGASSLVFEYLNQGESYSNVKKIYSVNIVYFSLGRGDDYVYEGRVEFRGRHVKDRLELSTSQQELFKIKDIYQIFPEYYVLRVNQFDGQTKDNLDEWIYFLKNSEIKEEFSAQGLPEAKERLREERLEGVDREAYHRFLKDRQYEISILASTRAAAELEGWKKGIQEGLEQGLEEGLRLQQIRIAQSLKRSGSPAEFIADVTGLTIAEVNALNPEQ
ncbi:MAG: Rpn family recombination-promoting nuclease/putative transposase [Leptolyngbyaceae bacterium]|nr:Rpn family recombination-promoting nuclease/putative transposase [Leptolyngbyaceae bacterium]